MAQSKNGPRKPATKFPHLRKQMQKNALPTQLPKGKFVQNQKRPAKP